MTTTMILQWGYEEEKRKADRNLILSAEDTDDEDYEKILPRTFALKSKINGKFLRYFSNEGGRESSDGILKFSGDRLVSPYTKFQAEEAMALKGYVHIKCCYNNKYWVRESAESNFIVAAANQAEEDLSKWSCTMFEAIYDEVNEAYHFDHVKLDCMLSQTMKDYPEGTDPKDESRLYASVESRNRSGITTVVDWDSIFILPKHVAFKGNNEKFLSLKSDGDDYLEFSSTDIADESVAHEIFAGDDGNVRIRNKKSGNFWTHDGDDNNWIKVKQADANSKDPSILFTPLKVDSNTVALLNKASNRFCKRLIDHGKTNYLNSSLPTVSKEAHLEVSEVVVARTIQNIKYRLKDARVYGQKVISMVSGDAMNKSRKATETLTFKFSFEDKKKKNWTSSVSTNIGFSLTFEGDFPLIGDGKMILSREMGASYSWGETHKDKVLHEYVKTVTVAPMSRVKVNAIINQAAYDVPFSYEQTDILKNGTEISRVYHDGVFSGVNSFGYDFKTEAVSFTA